MRVVLPTKGDVIAVHRQKAVIRDRDAMGIAGQVLQDMLRPAEGSLGVDDPLLAKQSAQERCERLLVSQGCKSPWKAICFWWKARRNPATNFPRNTRLSTLTGKKKWGGERIHRERSSDRPPPGTTQWICGWRCKVCPQVWRILRKPISAPRRAGSAATSSSVAALASNNRPKRSFLFCQINGTSACGTLKTTWK